MSLILPRFRRRLAAGNAPPTAARAAVAIRPACSPAALASPLLEQAVAALLAVLDDYLPPPVGSLPQPSISLVSLDERTVGLGNRRGMEARGGFVVIAQQGIRLEALVRFQLWAAALADVDTATDTLLTRLVTDRDTLWSRGVLRLALQNTPPADRLTAVNAWRRMSDYQVLFEFRYQETDGAASLITRIPIHSELERRGLPPQETTVVSAELARWDNLDAPPLSVRGPFRAAALTALAFIPVAAPTGMVTLQRTFTGAAGVPTLYLNLAAFLSAVTAPVSPERHGQVRFATLSDFLAAFSPGGDPVLLGDWDNDGVADSYEIRLLALEPAILLASAGERLELLFEPTAFDQTAVVYWRLGSA
jgi:hypothetical protein